MIRAVDTAVAAAVQANELYIAILVELQFNSEDLLIWSGIGDFVWVNRTFTGAGNLLSIGGSEETVETRAVSVAIGLSGVPTDLIGYAQVVNWRGQPARIWLALLTPSGELLGDPVAVMSGRMDVLSWRRVIRRPSLSPWKAASRTSIELGCVATQIATSKTNIRAT